MRRIALKDRLSESLHLLTLWAFAVAQPLYGLLGDQAGFLVANRADRMDILLLVLSLSLGLPLIGILVKDLLGLTGKGFRKALLAVLFSLLMALILLPALRSLELVPGSVLILTVLGAALGLGGLFAFAYERKPAIRRFLTWLWPAVLVFPILFLGFSDVTPLVFGSPGPPPKLVSPATQEKDYPPVVMVIWDELPLSSLLDEAGRIDAVRYPNFARFAAESTWFRRTYTAGASTLWAVPPILSGQMPALSEQATPGQQAVNLFTWLGGTHRMANVIEKHTALCPETLCIRRKKRFKQLRRTLADLGMVYLHLILPRPLAATLPDVSNTWGHFGEGSAPQPQRAPQNPKPVTVDEAGTGSVIAIDQPSTRKGKAAVPGHQWKRFHQFLNRIRPVAPGEKPSLNFVHILFPHVPFNYLPSGKYYSIGPYQYFTTWRNEREIYFDYQRHLLQLGAVDTLMGDLMARLKAQGLYDRALIIIVADHGASWNRPGDERRKLTRTNAADLLAVPLFIKRPGQKTPGVFEKPLRTVDILPTVADMMDLPLPGPVDGRSALDPGFPEIDRIEVVDNLGQKRERLSLATLLPTETTDRKNRWFGSGNPDRVFGSGQPAAPFGDWVGKPLKTLPVRSGAGGSFRLADPAAYDALDVRDNFSPALVVGKITLDRRNRLPADVAIAVNDIVWSTYPLLSRAGSDLIFGGMVPEKSFRPGKNRIRIFAIDGRGARPVLTEIPPVPLHSTAPRS